MTTPAASFQQLVDHLEQTEIVVIVTARATGQQVATAVWAVVIEGVPYVRSFLGPEGWWYRRVKRGSSTWFTLGDGHVAVSDPAAALDQPQVAVRLEPVPADAPIQTTIDAAMAGKYHEHPNEVAGINDPKAVACTFRVAAL
jgi:hypothetical protein